MTEDENHLVDINQGTIEELEAVPGIGPALAQRILAARPFSSIQDLTRVSGIGPQSLERLRPYLTDAGVQAAALPEETMSEKRGSEEPAAEEPSRALDELAEPHLAAEPEEMQKSPAQTAGEDSPAQPMRAGTDISVGEEEGEPLPAVLREEQPPRQTEEKPQVEAAEVRKATPAPAQANPSGAEARPVQRGEVIWVGVALAVLVLALSLLFNLGTLSLINGTLDYASSADMRALSSQADALATRVQVLEGDVEMLQSRLNTIETLGGRVSTLERSSETLRGDLSATVQELEALQAQTEEFSNQIEELRSRNNVFQNFLDGLRGLLNSTPSP